MVFTSMKKVPPTHGPSRPAQAWCSQPVVPPVTQQLPKHHHKPPVSKDQIAAAGGETATAIIMFIKV